MRYYLLTGGTGLLGRYLIRDLTLAGIPLAVMLRGTRLVTARQRLESVMMHWERQLERALPRPVLLEGELTEADLSLSAAGTDWVRRHVKGVIHSAASLSFQQAENRDDEPWRTNVGGTRNLLKLVDLAQIREFHYVSTCYVCGLRSGRVLESELRVGQKFGNDYEASKAESEELVRAHPGIQSLTVHRPAIIVGDSQTGFTNTFHGFYTPLQVVHSLVNRLPNGAIKAGPVMEALGLAGEDSKNIVPVDWVSAAMTHIIADPRRHGKTYHLAPNTRVSARTLCDAITSAIREFSVKTDATPAKTNGGPVPGLRDIETFIRDQMKVYQAYWRNDPEFDTTNVVACGCPPCPNWDESRLRTLCRFAIERNFFWPRGESVTPDFDVTALLRARLETVNGTPIATDRCVDLQVNGCGGGQWHMLFQHGDVRAFSEGLSDASISRAYTSVTALAALARREKSMEDLLRDGALVIQSKADGNGSWSKVFARLMG
jgi:thioester reductase-like protein